jgi:serine/threonine protein kinase
MESTLKILVIDDDKVGGFDLYQDLSGIPGGPEFELVWKRSGVEAMALLQRTPVDLILLDQLFMPAGGLTVQDFYVQNEDTGEILPLPPGASRAAITDPVQAEQGFLILTKLHEERKARQIPVIFCTAYPDEALGMRAMREGAKDYINKAHLQQYGVINVLLPKLREVLQYPETRAEFLDSIVSSGVPLAEFARNLLLKESEKYKRLAKRFIKEVFEKASEGKQLVNIGDIHAAIQGVSIHPETLSLPDYSPLLENKLKDYRIERHSGRDAGCSYLFHGWDEEKPVLIELLKPELMKERVEDAQITQVNEQLRILNGAGFTAPEIGKATLGEPDSYLGVDCLIYAVLPRPRGEYESLREYLGKLGVLHSGRVKDLGVELCGILRQLHARGIPHGCLRPEIIFLTYEARQIQLAGVGLSAFIDFQKYRSPYVAPESTVALPSDMWGVGIILHEMLIGAPPNIPQSGVPYIDYLGEFESPVSNCLMRDPDVRWDIEQVIGSLQSLMGVTQEKFIKLSPSAPPSQYERPINEKLRQGLNRPDFKGVLLTNGFFPLDSGQPDREIDVTAVGEYGITLFDIKGPYAVREDQRVAETINRLNSRLQGFRRLFNKLPSIPARPGQPSDGEGKLPLGRYIHPFLLVQDGTPLANLTIHRTAVKTTSEAVRWILQGGDRQRPVLEPDQIQQVVTLLRNSAHDYASPTRRIGDYHIEWVLPARSGKKSFELVVSRGGQTFLLREHRLYEEFITLQEVSREVESLRRRLTAVGDIRRRENLFCPQDLVLLNSDWELIDRADDPDLTVGYEVYEWKEGWEGYRFLDDSSLKGLSLPAKLLVMLGAVRGLFQLHQAGLNFTGNLSPGDVIVCYEHNQNPSATMVIPPFDISERPVSLYTAPEALAPAADSVTPLSDVYCLGIAFLELLVGQALEVAQGEAIQKGRGLPAFPFPTGSEAHVVLSIIEAMVVHGAKGRIRLNELIHNLETVLHYKTLTEKYQVDQVRRQEQSQTFDFISDQGLRLLTAQGSAQTNPKSCFLTAQDITLQFIRALVCQRCQNQGAEYRYPDRDFNVGCHQDPWVLERKQQAPTFVICDYPYFRTPASRFLALPNVSDELKQQVKKAERIAYIGSRHRGNPPPVETQEALNIATELVKWWKPSQ